MKYAILGPRNAINRVRDTAPTAPEVRFVEIADEQAESVALMLAERQMPIWLSDEVVSRLSVIASGDRLQWDEETKELTRVTPPLPVPAEVPLWAFRQVLIEDGLLAGILAAVSSNAVLTNFLEYGNFVSRGSPSLAQMAAQLGKTSDEVDDYFRRAAALSL